MTLKELAALANVSVSTASKAFNNAPDVSGETKKEIYKIAKQYGCFGKFYKGKHHKKVFAIICPEIKGDYYENFISCFKKYAENNNALISVSVNDFDEEKSHELIEYYASYLHVDAILVFGLKKEIKKGYETPIVSLGARVNGVDNVKVDFEKGFYNAVKFLKSQNHKKIAFIGDILTKSKQNSFLLAMSRNNLCVKDEWVITTDMRFENSGATAAKIILNMKEKCTAVVCAYDSIAIGFINEIKRYGYNVPEDFSVVGCDNFSISDYLSTPLTTIDSASDKLSEIVFEILSKKIKNKYYSLNSEICIEPELIIRGTVKKING